MSEIKKHILIVDDEQIILDSIKKHLRKESDYVLYAAMSVAEAQSILERETINIVLTDLMMPCVDGLEFLSIINDIDKNILSIMITGYATIKTALQATQLGAFDYLAKPFTREELTDNVRRAANLIETMSKQSVGIHCTDSDDRPEKIKKIGEDTWLVQQEDASVLIGVERTFLYKIGDIQNIYLPNIGDHIRQGSLFFQAFSAGMRSESLLAPLSGAVLEVNKYVIDAPDKALRDPYEKGWLIRIAPSNFKEEVKLMGL